MNFIRYTRRRLHVGLAAAMRGFTLVELLVAMTIGLIILGAVAQIFATSSATYNVEEDLARVQENGRFAMDFIRRDLRMGGYAGCLNVNQDLNANVTYNINNELATTDFATNFVATEHIRGFDYVSGTTWSPALPGAGFLTNAEVRADTDVVVIRRGDAPIVRLQSAMAGTAGTLDIVNNSGLAANDIVMVADCTDVDIFQISNDPASAPVAHAGAGNADADLSKAYDDDAELMKLTTRVYYIGTGAFGGPSLFRKEMDQGVMTAGQELVEDVETMQILYGEDTDLDGSADIYVLPANVINWDRVASIRIGLVVRTASERGPDVDTRVYPVIAGANFDPVDDRRQRRVFASTIQIRNQRN